MGKRIYSFNIRSSSSINTEQPFPKASDHQRTDQPQQTQSKFSDGDKCCFLLVHAKNQEKAVYTRCWPDQSKQPSAPETE